MRARFSLRGCSTESAASMQETTEQPTLAPEAVNGLTEAAARAQDWAGEPFLRADEDPAVVLAPGTARRLALDNAIEEMDRGQDAPSYEWRRRYALLLGLERVLSDRPPRLASGTELRRHQIDALAGMLTELIAAAQAAPELVNGNGAYAELEAEEEEEDELEPAAALELDGDELPAPLSPEEDPGAVRRFRFRHPTASGKTIAAAGFVEAARTLGVLILTHRRLLVSQFNRDLTDEGYGDRFSPTIERGQEPLRGANPLTIQTYAWFARHQESISREAYQLVICDEAHTALGEKTSAAIRAFPEPIYIGMTATEQLIAKQVSDVFPASIDDLPLQDAARQIVDRRREHVGHLLRDELFRRRHADVDRLRERADRGARLLAQGSVRLVADDELVGVAGDRLLVAREPRVRLDRQRVAVSK